MSFTRRIAQTALLTAAGAASVVGAAAGSASAAELPSTPDVGGLTNLDGAGLAGTVDGASQNATGMAGEKGGETVQSSLPAAGKAVGAAGNTAVPAAQNLTGETVGTTGDLLGSTASQAAGSGLTEQLPTSGLPGTDGLGLPLVG